MAPTGTVLIVIGLGLIGVTFTIGIWQGVVAVVPGFITNTVAGGRVMHDENGGLGKAIKTTILLLAVVCLPFGGYQYYQYNRSPSESDKLTFIYGCSDYAANKIFKDDSKGNTGDAKDICYCLWPDLVGKYQTAGAINKEVKDSKGFNFGADSTKMYNVCVHEKIYN